MTCSFCQQVNPPTMPLPDGRCVCFGCVKRHEVRQQLAGLVLGRLHEPEAPATTGPEPVVGEA
jgi:hypothetical protein